MALKILLDVRMRLLGLIAVKVKNADFEFGVKLGRCGLVCEETED